MLDQQPYQLLLAATLSSMACPGRGTSSFSLNTRLHPSWRAGRHADLMLILLYWSNTKCSTCVVSILFQILATTAVVNADTFAVVAVQDTVHSKAQPSKMLTTGGSAFRSSLRICSLLLNTDLLAVRICPLSANSTWRVWGHFVRDKATCCYDLP